MELYKVIRPTNKRIPILISSPHSGTAFPEDLKGHFLNAMIDAPDDTDWYVDKLYGFAQEMGITLITAQYSRWVIDLNRDPKSIPLYDDGRTITELCPTINFLGEPLYHQGMEPDSDEINRRLTLYYWPYYQAIEGLLTELKEEFGYVLFWDAHSIRQYVPTIRQKAFPDLILGDNDEKSADPELSRSVLSILNKSKLKVNHNNPFKGGHLTRYFGKPEIHQHALQLEMSKVNYMDDSETKYDEGRAIRIQTLLKRTFESLTQTLKTL